MKFTTKKFGSIATAAVLAGTMAFMPATAFAVSFNDEASSTVAGTTVLNKEWDAASAAQFSNDEVFKYDVTFKDAQQVGSWIPDTLTKDTKEVTLSSKWADNATSDLKSKASLTAKQLLGEYSFTNPGVYNFTVKEADTKNPNITYDTHEYTVSVVVTMPDTYPNDPTPVIESVGVKTTDANGKTTKTTADFTNTAAANDSLTVTKKVSGAAANTTDVFDYTLTVSGASGKYTVNMPDGTTRTLTAGEDFKFSLSHNQQIVVNNLPDGATYTVTETNTRGYDSTDVADEDDTTAPIVKKGEGTPTGKGTISKDGDTVAFTNNKGFASGTGITMNTLPFVVVATVAVAGGAALVISRRRHAGEDF